MVTAAGMTPFTPEGARGPGRMVFDNGDGTESLAVIGVVDGVSKLEHAKAGTGGI